MASLLWSAAPMPSRPMRSVLPLHDLTRLDTQSPSTANDVMPDNKFKKEPRVPGKEGLIGNPGRPGNLHYGSGKTHAARITLEWSIFLAERELRPKGEQ